MALLSPQVAKITGTSFTPAAATAGAGGDTFPLVSPYQHLEVRNGAGASITVTLDVPGTNEDGQPNPDPAIVVAAGTTAIIGPFAPRHVDPATGLIKVTYSSATSVTVALLA